MIPEQSGTDQVLTELSKEVIWCEHKLCNRFKSVGAWNRWTDRGIASQLVRLLIHLLKREYQPQRRSDSWLDSITDSRLQIELAITDSPSLKKYPLLELAEIYQRARSTATKQTHLPLSTFPETYPYSLDKILAEDWLLE